MNSDVSERTQPVSRIYVSIWGGEFEFDRSLTVENLKLGGFTFLELIGANFGLACHVKM